jgi:hypothetical protein
MVPCTMMFFFEYSLRTLHKTITLDNVQKTLLRLLNLPVPELIDPVFKKLPELIDPVFKKTGSVNSGTDDI